MKETSKVDSKAVGRRLRAMRETSGRQRFLVAKRAKVTLAELDQIEKGSAIVSVGSIQRVAGALGTTLLDVIRQLAQPAPKQQTDTEAPRLSDIADAILRLQVDGSKEDAVVGAMVDAAMKACDNNQSASARLLGMERKAFVRRLLSARRKRR
jgi:transcriptional regulator with XRE-family HTH domain